MTGEADARATGRRIAVKIEYDGTAYRGSQYQDNGPSIQSELESAIRKLTGAHARAAFAGRTDSGVHALGQVAVFDTPSTLPVAQVVRGLNHFLPPDISVQAAVETAPGFDPRRHAKSRVYGYRIDTAPVRSPLLRDRVWHIGRALDIGAMREAAQALVGKHDFAAFAGPYEGSTVRTLRRCDVAQAGPEVTVEMEAEAFLPHQVRRTVGPLADVGLGRRAVEDIRALLRQGAASSAGPAAPACGLYLLRIEYDGLEFGAAEEDGQDA